MGTSLARRLRTPSSRASRLPLAAARCISALSRSSCSSPARPRLRPLHAAQRTFLFDLHLHLLPLLLAPRQLLVEQGVLLLQHPHCLLLLGDAALLLFIQVLQLDQFLHQLLLVGLLVDHSAALR